MQAIGIGRPTRQDTYDLRGELLADDNANVHAHVEATHTYPSDEEHSVLEDDSDGEDREVDYMDDDDDGSSSLSIPNESIDFDLVYSLHSFAATVEGQANVVKGDSLFLMDDSNSYWWLVRVLKTQEVGYIPAENIETPFERLARLNKHRNVDLASATQAELQEDVHASRDRLRNNLVSSRTGQNTPSPIPQKTPGPRPGQDRGVIFTPALYVHRYPPAIWGEYDEEEEDVEWDDEPYEDEDPELADDEWYKRKDADDAAALGMEPDDGMGWDDSVVEDLQTRSQPAAPAGLPLALQPGGRPNPQMSPGQVQDPTLRTQTSREILAAKASPPTSPGKSMDPADVTITRKLSATPSIARDDEVATSGPLLPSAIMQKQEEERKRTREEIEALEEVARKKSKAGPQKSAPAVAAPQQKVNAAPVAGGKLRKEQSDEDSGKKKRGGLFSGLFGGGKKDKAKSAGVSSADGGSIELGRASSESGRSSSLYGAGSSNQHGTAESGSSAATATQQQPAIASSMRNTGTPIKQQPQQQPGPQTPPEQISSHASQLRQRDQQQQALYKQYLTHSPASPPEASPNYGLQTASAVMSGASGSFNNSASSAIGLGLPGTRQRPGSLILQGAAVDGQGVGVPDLSVIRVFAGENLQTEATFKTVLLNSSTTSSDLIRQAMQRFRLPSGEDENDYYLAVKQLEGSAAVLMASEHPLGVFETLVEAAMELPKVKRSSVGSISSVVSNLSMHPAIKKLSMNDFTDDSAVKFYLNRKTNDSALGGIMGGDGDETLMADSTVDSVASSSQYLSVNPTNPNNVNAERFSSPSFRFALQLVIYADDLPDDMVFDPVTEAIVFKHTLRDRAQSNASASSKLSQTMRRKVFMFPKNVTVAEVIEMGLERFGILDGVVDGGDEVEDKMTKRRSSTRVRYGLTADIGIQERELSPSSKVIDAYPSPPTYRAAERRNSDSKRRSVDSAQLLGTFDDVNPEDPTFILRRAVSYRSSTSRHRLSAPLDEIALSRMHRESASGSSVNSDSGIVEDAKPKQLSRQELIAQQRAASRANQKLILSAQTNSVRGVDVLLPGNAMIRSSRYDGETGDRMRYSYVEPDGETYDISDIVEEEWQGNADANKNDLLEGVLVRNKDGLGDNFDRVLNKIKDGKAARAAMSRSASQLTDRDITRSTSPSEYSTDTGGYDLANSRSTTPNARTPTPTSNHTRSGSATSRNLTVNTQARAKSNTPTNASKPRPERNASIASVMSDLSTSYGTSPGYATPISHLPGDTPEESPREVITPRPQIPRPFLPKNDFGIDYMMAMIDVKATLPRAPTPPPLDPVDELLFGRKLDLESVHPQLRDIYAGSFKQLEAMDKQTLDGFLQRTVSAG
ncbi:hypothetical protein HWV62_34333 [Athelia sp. TMB]|nr:hypothetical protein HWV62_34333 [Athelia sp. TMB]